MYRESGYECGLMLEYMLLKILKSFKAHAEGKVLIRLTEIIQTKGKFEKLELGKLIALMREEFYPRKNPKIAGASILTVVCQTLNVKHKHLLCINFSGLVDIRNNCVHANKVMPTKEEIDYFKNDLKRLSDVFEDIFRMELLPVSNEFKKTFDIIDSTKPMINHPIQKNIPNHEKSKFSSIVDFIVNNIIKKIDNESILMIVAIILVFIAAIVYFHSG